MEVEIVDDVSDGGRLFQIRAAAAGKARSRDELRRVAGTPITPVSQSDYGKRTVPVNALRQTKPIKSRNNAVT